jgi:hypothetical protein
MATLPAIFFVRLYGLTGRNVHRLGSGSGNRRAAIDKGADTRQGVFERTGQRGAGKHEGEGEDKAEASHLTVSGLAIGVARRFVGRLITSRCFRTPTRKAKNGFIAQEIYFVAWDG